MSSFFKKILEATRLTGRGQVAEATAAIRQALAEKGAQAPRRHDGPTAVVLDGLVREVDRRGASEASAAAHTEDMAYANLDDRAEAGRSKGDDIGVVEPVEPKPRPESFSESTFTNASGTRIFKLFQPAGFEGRPLPLVVMLHGCTQNPDDFATGTRMNALAQEQGFFVLYPAQAVRSNAHKCWNWFVPADQQRGHGEPALLAGMTRHVMQTHAIDADRVYVAGLSAGGAMAAILAREYPDLFAAAGVHSGLAAGAAHDVASAFMAMKMGASAKASRPVAEPLGAARPGSDGGDTVRRASAPLIVFHGDADTTVSVANADAVTRSVLDADMTGGAEPAVERADIGNGTRTATRTVWRPAAGPSRAEQWLVYGAPHAWSGGAAAGTFTDPAGPDASREMLRFFFEHPLRATAGR